MSILEEMKRRWQTSRNVLDGDAARLERQLTWRLIGALILIATLAGLAFGFTLDVHSTAYIAGIALLVLFPVFYLADGHHAYPRIAALLIGLCQFLVVSFAAVYSNVVLNAMALPYRDMELAALDAMIGIDWPALVLWIDSKAWLAITFCIAYWSLNYQPLLLLIGLAIWRGSREIHAFLLAWTIALLFTTAISPLTPAVAGYAHFGIDVAALQHMKSQGGYIYLPVLEAVRDGSLRHLDLEALKGIVTFPSFHASAAVLLAWGFWQLPYARWPMLALNAVMTVSVVYAGSHYVTDLIGGCAIAAAAIVTAGNNRAVRSLGRWLKPVSRCEQGAAPLEQA
jgi:membrane-associated phospholipid phosphatase